VISLTWNINGGTDSNGTYIRNGNVSAPDLTCYSYHKKCELPETSQGLAHSYGEAALSGPECAPYDDISDVMNNRSNSGYWCRRTPGHKEFAYRFSEYNPDDVHGTYPRFTNRVITASAGQCFNYSQTHSSLTKDVNGDFSVWNFTFTNGSYTSSITIPRRSDARGGTTYIYRGTDVPLSETRWRCGPRCMEMWAHNSPGISPDNETSTFYQCPITISHVGNTEYDSQNISDYMARLAASAIGLQGRPTMAPGLEGQPLVPIWTQYQYYAFG
jgi:hypothetical protein